MHKTLCYSLISLEKLTKNKKQKRKQPLCGQHQEKFTSPWWFQKVWNINMDFEEHNDNNQWTVINKIQNGTHMHI